MGQIGKQILTIVLLLVAGACVCAHAQETGPADKVANLAGPASAVGAGDAALPAAGASAIGFVVDPLTGVALNGFDVVSYFTETTPLPGKPDFEYDWSGAPWYFATKANRDVFIEHPEVYAPQFAGHGAMAVARGFLSDGNPRVYLVFGNRLYLFYSAGNRDAFVLSGNEIVDRAHAQWRDLVTAANAGR